MTRALIIDDDEQVAGFLSSGLASHGYQSFVAANGMTALNAAQRQPFDVVILDIELPDLDGLEVLRRIRALQPDSVIITMAPTDGGPRLLASFDAAADDFMTKPLVFEELVARIRARIRRPDVGASSTLRAGDIQLDLGSRRAMTKVGAVDLTAREFALAETFFRHPDQVLSPQQLLNHVWGYDFSPGSNIVAVYVRTLRRKLGTEVIRTVRGMGYRLQM